MSYHRQLKSGLWEYQFQRKGMLKPTYVIYETEEEGDIMSAHIELSLDKGIVPSELLRSKMHTVSDLLSSYSDDAVPALAPSSANLIPTLDKLVGTMKVTAITNDWVDQWIKVLKTDLKPSTVKKRVELLARAVDWGIRKKTIPLVNNPMRTLPRGYAGTANRHDEWDGMRTRRLSEDGLEEGTIRKVLLNKEEHLIFDMALESAMRMREMYTLTVDQVNIAKSTIFLEKTKNGTKRQVPMSSVLKKLLTVYLSTLEGDRLFAEWWNGTYDDGSQESVKYLDGVSTRLSQRFAARFAKAGCPDLTFHDLRHEATSRIYERTTFTDLQIASITGHKDPRMLKRYANLRGSDLSTRMW